jgi:hypothetical protein
LGFDESKKREAVFSPVAGDKSQGSRFRHRHGMTIHPRTHFPSLSGNAMEIHRLPQIEMFFGGENYIKCLKRSGLCNNLQFCLPLPRCMNL